MKHIIVLGGGMVGSAIAADLSISYDVTVADNDQSVLSKLSAMYSVEPVCADFASFETLRKITEKSDLVISAVPGFLGFKTLERLIRCKKNVVDISFFPENAFLLDQAARDAGVAAVFDCGVAPGMDNIILGRLNETMDIEHFTCMVGGLPFERKKPFEYKAPFSPTDVIEEYCRPARFVENGRILTKEAMSDVEQVYFERPGVTLEAFNTDGLRSLLQTMKHIPHMREKTLRYPGHIAFIAGMRDAGFFSTTPVHIRRQTITPLEFTSKLLIDEWKLLPEEKEFTVMRIEIKGKKQGRHIQIIYDLYDEFDEKTGFSSMARTTGYTCTAVANMLLQGEYNGAGIIPPEIIGKEEALFQRIVSYLEERGVCYRYTEQTISGSSP